MKMLFMLQICVLFLLSSAFAQITITADDFPEYGTVVQDWGVDDVVFDPGPTGGPQGWNVTGYDYELGRTKSWLDPADTPYAGEFPMANYCVNQGAGGYSYFLVDDVGVWSLGYVFFEDSIVVVPLDSPGLIFPLPLEYGTEWSSVHLHTFVSSPGVTVTEVDSTVRMVNAWGTMTTPDWTLPVIRNMYHTMKWSIVNDVPGDPEHEWGYLWYSSEMIAKEVRFSQEGDVGPGFTEGNLTYTYPDTTEAVEPVRGPVADNFSVGQNYPNPFNPTTTLPISLQQASKVEVTIYNELGKVVSREEMNFGPGEHTVPFDGSAWASGNYFANVKTGNQQQTKRMTLVK